MRFLILICISISCFAQNKKPDSTFCDCRKARTVELLSKKTVGKTLAPSGAGEYLEISNLSHDAGYSFEKEHNSAWYKLIIKNPGTLTFDIIPNKAGDDYDFMLFRAYSDVFCDSLLNFKIKPLRACISRPKKDSTGKTGLGYDAKAEFVNTNAAPYAKALTVKRGDIYYLVLDNLKENGEGHRIEFMLTTEALIQGRILDENSKPLVAEISITNAQGEIVQTDQSEKDGTYAIDAHLMSGTDYSINFYQENSLTYTTSFRLADTAQLKSLKTILPKLKKGLKYSVGTINFIGGSEQTLPQAVPAMMNLVKLMKKNPGLKILIIGHMHGAGFTTKEYDLKFTRGRATTVKDFLIKNGIDAARVEIDGKGSTEMIFKNTIIESEAAQNRRVEIMVLEY